MQKRLVFRILFTAIAAFTCLSLIAAGPAQTQEAGQPGEFIVSDTLDLLTVNIAHGRGTGLNQLLVSHEGHRKNLADIAETLRRSTAHVVALQEADAPSWWSGCFDHVQHIVEIADYTAVVHGLHADSWLYSYGTALLSRVRLHRTESHSFSPSWPTATKGYVLGAVLWRGRSDSVRAHSVSLVSVHLDFSRRTVRAAQIAELLTHLAELPRPLIVMGDFNADWSEADSPVRALAREADLRAYQPTAAGLSTYKDTGRLDWILISDELAFRDYAVLPDVVSDHLAVFARVGFKSKEMMP